MNYNLSIYELGKLLKDIEKNYKMNLLCNIKLSGGWMTMTGSVKVDYVPTEEVMLKGNNIINLILNNNSEEGNFVKITGQKDGKFTINLAATKYKEIHKGGLNIDMTKEKPDQCTLKIDEGMIFTINAPVKEIEGLIKKS